MTKDLNNPWGSLCCSAYDYLNGTLFSSGGGGVEAESFFFFQKANLFCNHPLGFNPSSPGFKFKSVAKW